MKNRFFRALALCTAMTAMFLTGVVTAGAEETTEAAADAAQESAEEAKDQEILVVSFGTSYNDSREATIGAIENAIAEAFPEYDVKRAFTAQTIIDILEERDGLEIDNVEEALNRAADSGVKTLIVQPTHLMDGLEYADLAETVAAFADSFERVEIADPLLISDEDYEKVIAAITEATAAYDDGETAVCYMGHGTEAESNAIYATLQEKLTEAGYENYFIGTVEAEPTLEDVLAAVGEGSYTKAVLSPLMVVAGDHANNDMAGDEEGSWKTEFENAGYEVTCNLQGLGELEAIQAIYVEHTQAAIDSLAE